MAREAHVHLEKNILVLFEGLRLDLLSELDHRLEMGVMLVLTLQLKHVCVSFWYVEARVAT